MHLCESTDEQRGILLGDDTNAEDICMCRVYSSTYVSTAPGYISDVLHESRLEECIENLSLNGKSPKLRNAAKEEYNDCREGCVTARDVVLRKCGQTEALPFEKCYPNR